MSNHDAAVGIEQTQSESQFHRTTGPSQPNPNHYSGDNGFGNYGYILVNGVWVDPENEGELYDALTHPGKAPPSQHLPALSKGPRIMTPSEENGFYQAFMDDMEGDEADDREGDPRYLRISPATFAQWAVGARIGDRYSSKVLPVEVSSFMDHSSVPIWISLFLTRHACEPKGNRLKVIIKASRRRTIPSITPKTKIERKPQYDIETGSTLSGVYDPERTPSPLFSAQGQFYPLLPPISYNLGLL